MTFTYTYCGVNARLAECLFNSVLNVKAVVATFNQEKALVGAFFVIVQLVVEPMDRFAALVTTARIPTVPSGDQAIPTQAAAAASCILHLKRDIAVIFIIFREGTRDLCKQEFQFMVEILCYVCSYHCNAKCTSH